MANLGPLVKGKTVFCAFYDAASRVRIGKGVIDIIQACRDISTNSVTIKRTWD